jgi:hypothetical protein
VRLTGVKLLAVVGGGPTDFNGSRLTVGTSTEELELVQLELAWSPLLGQPESVSSRVELSMEFRERGEYPYADRKCSSEKSKLSKLAMLLDVTLAREFCLEHWEPEGANQN